MFTFIDIIFFVIILFFAIMAASHGFIKELFSKLAVIAGLIAAFFFCGKLAPHLAKVVNNPTVDLIIAFLLLFIVVFLAVKIVQMIIGSIFSGEILKSLDHVLGFLFGLLEGAVIVSCILIILKAQPWFNADSVLNDSTIASFLLPVLDKPVNYIRGMLV